VVVWVFMQTQLVLILAGLLVCSAAGYSGFDCGQGKSRCLAPPTLHALLLYCCASRCELLDAVSAPHDTGKHEMVVIYLLATVTRPTAHNPEQVLSVLGCVTCAGSAILVLASHKCPSDVHQHYLSCFRSLALRVKRCSIKAWPHPHQGRRQGCGSLQLVANVTGALCPEGVSTPSLLACRATIRHWCTLARGVLLCIPVHGLQGMLNRSHPLFQGTRCCAVQQSFLHRCAQQQLLWQALSDTAAACGSIILMF
jgi:hypothetical protein